MSRAAWLPIIAIIAIIALTACSGHDGGVATTAPSSTVVSTATTTSVPDVSRSTASAAFCGLAGKAVNGQVDFTSDDEIALLNDDPSLSPNQRALISQATADAKRQVATMVYANDLLVKAVNSICGTTFTPTTLVQ